MIFHLGQYVLVNDSFKKAFKLLYNDSACNDLETIYTNSFEYFNKTTSIKTYFKNYYNNSEVYILDSFSNSITLTPVEEVTALDLLVLKKRTHVFEKEVKSFVDKLYLNKYNYSTSFTDIVDKYKLPRHYLLKALTTGCPDDEYPEARKWNSDLQKILDKEQLTLDEFKEKILRDYSNEPNKKFVNVSYKLLDLIYLCINGDYELLSHTSLKLKIKDKSVFENIVSLLLDLNIHKSIYNDIYNNQEYSVILVNSSLIYNLFKSEFDNFSFLLNISKMFSHYLYKKLIVTNSFVLQNELSSNYIQEFLYRFNTLYSIDKYSSHLYTLNKVDESKYKVCQDLIYLGIDKIEFSNDRYIGVT